MIHAMIFVQRYTVLTSPCHRPKVLIFSSSAHSHRERPPHVACYQLKPVHHSLTQPILHSATEKLQYPEVVRYSVERDVRLQEAEVDWGEDLVISGKGLTDPVLQVELNEDGPDVEQEILPDWVERP
jgi:hypothetical protein